MYFSVKLCAIFEILWVSGDVWYSRHIWYTGS